MAEAETVRVIKRDQSAEDFDPLKLAGAMYRATTGAAGEFRDALNLAVAIQTYLCQERCRCVSSAAVFEMAVMVLRQVGLEEAAVMMERRHAWRKVRRARLRIRHEGGQITAWEKTWLSRLTERGWRVSVRTGRIIAGQIEWELLSQDVSLIPRETALTMLNARVAALGLADAVPVRQPAAQY